MTPSQADLDRARYVRTILAWHGATQTDLGRLLGCSQVAAGRKLRGQRRFSIDELLRIAEAFAVDPANLMRPPALEPMLGSKPAGDLLTCTKYQVPLVGTPGASGSRGDTFGIAVDIQDLDARRSAA